MTDTLRARRNPHPGPAPVAPAHTAPADLALARKYARMVPRYTSYPTAPHFHPGVDGEVYGDWLTRLPAGAELSLYAHIPFCDTLCWFCGCNTKIVQRYDPVASYLPVLLREIELVAERLPGGHACSHLHWGGGSPTLLKPEHILALGRAFAAHFPLTPDAEFAVEIDPRDLSQDQVAALGAAGVTRASLGVQDIDPAVQKAINRIQPLEVTAAAVERLRAVGVRDLNIDLVYGLPYQDTARLLASVEAMIALKPSRFALFGYAHVPHMKKHMRLIPSDSLAGPDARFEMAEAAAGRLLEAGYVRIGLDHFALPDDAMARLQAAGRLRRNFQGYTADQAAALIGFGASAIGQLPQGLVQNHTPIHAYAEAVRAGRLPVAKGVALTAEDRRRAGLIERLMCDLAVEVPADLAAGLEQELRGMAADGLIRRHGRRIEVTERGRPLMRCVAALFDAYLDTAQNRHSVAV
jgi:oxygen-independent coproporphyrinogen-3 oxidase